MMQAVLIPHDDMRENSIVEWDNDIEQVQALVGGYVERVRLTTDAALLVNEDGKMTGLPVNRRATLLLREMGRRTDFIVGDCVLVGDTGEDFVSAPEALVATLMAAL